MLIFVYESTEVDKLITLVLFFYHDATALSGPRPPHYRGFMITLRNTTIGRTPLDE